MLTKIIPRSVSLHARLLLRAVMCCLFMLDFISASNPTRPCRLYTRTSNAQLKVGIPPSPYSSPSPSPLLLLLLLLLLLSSSNHLSPLLSPLTKLYSSSSSSRALSSSLDHPWNGFLNAESSAEDGVVRLLARVAAGEDEGEERVMEEPRDGVGEVDILLGFGVACLLAG
jgi:hypothetical protein